MFLWRYIRGLGKSEAEQEEDSSSWPRQTGCYAIMLCKGRGERGAILYVCISPSLGPLAKAPPGARASGRQPSSPHRSSQLAQNTQQRPAPTQLPAPSSLPASCSQLPAQAAPVAPVLLSAPAPASASTSALVPAFRSSRSCSSSSSGSSSVATISAVTAVAQAPAPA